MDLSILLLFSIILVFNVSEIVVLLFQEPTSLLSIKVDELEFIDKE